MLDLWDVLVDYFSSDLLNLFWGVVFFLSGLCFFGEVFFVCLEGLLGVCKFGDVVEFNFL